MKAIVIDDFGTPDQLRICDIPTPEPKDNEVQIHIAYAGLNPVDWKIQEGLFKNHLPHEFPLIPGWDASGTISKLGKNVTKFKVGDEVYAYCRKPIIQMGTYAEYTCFDAKHVSLKPKNLSFAEAAGVPLVALTAWQALFDVAKIKGREDILIHAGAGGVGSVAIGLAKHAGAKVFTTASKKNHDYVKSLGADVAFDYTTCDFAEKLKKMLPKGVDVVFDCIGGDTQDKSFAIIKQGGRFVTIVNKIDDEKAEKYQVQPGYVFVRPDGKELDKITQLIEQQKIQPPNIQKFSIKEASLAQKKNKKGHTKGKIVLNIDF